MYIEICIMLPYVFNIFNYRTIVYMIPQFQTADLQKMVVGLAVLEHFKIIGCKIFLFISFSIVPFDYNR